jgi:hypothetical protein
LRKVILVSDEERRRPNALELEGKSILSEKFLK